MRVPLDMIPREQIEAGWEAEEERRKAMTPSDQNGELCRRLRKLTEQIADAAYSQGLSTAAEKAQEVNAAMLKLADLRQEVNDCLRALIEQQAAHIAELERDAGRWRAMRTRYVGWTSIGCWLKFQIPPDAFVTDSTAAEEADRLADAAIDAAKDKSHD